MQTRFLHNGMSRAFNVLMLVMLFSWSSVQSALAVGSGTVEDPYVFADGDTYTVEQYKGFYGVFTAPEDGIFTIYGTNYALYTDATFGTIDEAMQPQWNGNYNDDRGYSFECTAGNTYYIGNNFVADAVGIRISFGSGALAIEVKGIDPENGSMFDAGTGLVGLTFNQSVTIASATMKAGSAEAESVTLNAHGAYVSVDVKSQLNARYEDGSLKEGDDITFTFNGVAPAADTEALYNGDGVLVVTYKAGPKPMRLVSCTNLPGGDPAATKFLSYYLFDDPSGVITMTFSDPVNLTDGNKPIATLTYGNTEAEDPEETYSESLNVNSLGDNTIMISLKGKLRRAKDMVTSGTNYGTVTLRVANVRDMAGNYAYSEGSGTLGSFTYTFNFEEVSYTADTDWELDGKPATVIDADTKNVELWMRENGGKMTFEGAEFRYTSGGRDLTKTIARSELTVEYEGEDMTISIPVPNISADANTTITVALTGVERPDGLTTDVEPTAMDYFTKEFTTTGLVSTAFDITSAVWHEGEEDVNMIDGNIGVLTAGTTSTLTTNKDSEVGYATWELRDVTDPVNGYVRSGYVSGPIEEGGFTIDWYGESLEAGKDYTFTLKAWKSADDSYSGAEPNVGETSFTIHGAKEAYVYSDVTLDTDISEPFIMSSLDDNVLELSFSGPVTLTAVVNRGSGLSADCEVEAEDAEGRAWKITMPQLFIKDMPAIDVNVFVKDTEGRAVNKTANGLGTIMGNEANTWFEIHFTADFLKPDFTVEPADGAEVESIETITFGYEGGISLNWGATDAPITIYNRNTREAVATFTQDDVIEIEGESYFDPIVACYVKLDTPITDAGTYTVEVPAGFFILGDQMMANSSKATSVTYVIKGAEVPMEVTIDLAAGNVTEIPETLVVTFEGYDNVNNVDEPTLVDADGNSYPVHFDWGTDWNQLNVVLDNGAITAEGVYTLTIPAGAVELGDPDKLNTEDIVFVYTIGNTTAIDGLVGANGGKVTVYAVNGTVLLRDADAASVRSLAKGLYIINGKKVVIR